MAADGSPTWPADSSGPSRSASGEQLDNEIGQQKPFGTDNSDHRRFLPCPVPFRMPFFNWYHSFQKEGATKLLKRPMNQEEAASIEESTRLEHGCVMYLTTNGAYGGSIIGVLRSYWTRHTWKFPLRTPNNSFNPDSVRLWPKGEVLTGAMARNFWRVSRVTSYAMAGAMPGAIVGLLFSVAPAAALGGLMLRLDPRLRELNEALDRYNAEMKFKKHLEMGFRYAVNRNLEDLMQATFKGQKLSKEEFNQRFADNWKKGIEMQQKGEKK